jgi:D-alanyl-D-alanine carboxypeptidase/D-alanyl-D-alanine-endopeptidase (penicillin-binding protein 4)
VDELLLAEGATRLTIRAGARGGDRASVNLDPPGYPRVVNGLHTVDATDSTALGAMPLRIARDSAAGTVTVTGAVAAGSTRGIDVAYADQSAAFLSLLRDALATRGITVDGVALDTSRAVDTLFTTVSAPLGDILPAMMKPSQNQIAEVLFRAIALERTGLGSADSAQRLVDSTLRAWGVGEHDLVVRDGSGLSRYDYLSPRAIVTVLDHMRRSPHAGVYLASLPIAGVDGTLASRMKGTPAEGVARAKTGFVTAARSLSGYVPAADGRLVLFSLLCNNWTAPQRDVEAVQDAIVAQLVGLELGAAP